MWMDIGKLIREHIPDKNGNVLPEDLTSGSYEFRDLINTGIGALFEGKVIYDKTYGHVTYGCATCCGYGNNSTVLWFDPISLGYQGPPGYDGVWGYNVCTQQYEDVSSGFDGDWSSWDTSVVTVDTYGTHTPHNIGSTTTDTFGYIESTAHYPICPATYRHAGGGAQIFGITSVAPATYVIGTNGPMTISGFGFSGKGTPTVQFIGGGVSAIGATVSNDTTILATYVVSCSAAPTQSVVVNFGSFEGGRSSNPWPVVVVLPAAPTPTIQFAGNNVSGTTNVVVGQQIPLTASVTLPGCMTFASQSWSVPPGTAVGGYVNAAGTGIPDTTGGQVKALPPNSTTDPLSLDYTFYWVYSGSSFNMTYQYTMSGGFGSVNSPVATANFNVTGVTSPSVSPQNYGSLTVHTLTGCTGVPTGPWLEYGNYTGYAPPCPGPISGTPGISFTPSGTQPSGGGSFSFVQLINSDSNTYTTTAGTTKTCTFSSGLDKTYPYAAVSQGTATDAPALQLLSTNSSQSRSFNATMYLMWQSNSSGSIPVPLGYQTWQFSGSTNQSGGNWSTPSGSGGPVGGFTASTSSQASNGYPTWNNVSASLGCQ
jgi:hypothetical protein